VPGELADSNCGSGPVGSVVGSLGGPADAGVIDTEAGVGSPVATAVGVGEGSVVTATVWVGEGSAAADGVSVVGVGEGSATGGGAAVGAAGGSAGLSDVVSAETGSVEAVAASEVATAVGGPAQASANIMRPRKGSGSRERATAVQHPNASKMSPHGRVHTTSSFRKARAPERSTTAPARL